MSFFLFHDNKYTFKTNFIMYGYTVGGSFFLNSTQLLLATIAHIKQRRTFAV